MGLTGAGDYGDITPTQAFAGAEARLVAVLTRRLYDLVGVEGQASIDSWTKATERAKAILRELGLLRDDVCTGYSVVGGDIVHSLGKPCPVHQCPIVIGDAPPPPSIDGFAITDRLHEFCVDCNAAIEQAAALAKVTGSRDVRCELTNENGALHHGAVTSLTGVLTFQMTLPVYLDVDVATGKITGRVMTPSGPGDPPLRQLAVNRHDWDESDPRVARAFELMEKNLWERPEWEA